MNQDKKYLESARDRVDNNQASNQPKAEKPSQASPPPVQNKVSNRKTTEHHTFYHFRESRFGIDFWFRLAICVVGITMVLGVYSVMYSEYSDPDSLCPQMNQIFKIGLGFAVLFVVVGFLFMAFTSKWDE